MPELAPAARIAAVRALRESNVPLYEILHRSNNADSDK